MEVQTEKFADMKSTEIHRVDVFFLKPFKSRLMSLMIPSFFGSTHPRCSNWKFLDELSQACQMLVRYGPPPEPSNFQLYKVRDSGTKIVSNARNGGRTMVFNSIYKYLQL